MHGLSYEICDKFIPEISAYDFLAIEDKIEFIEVKYYMEHYFDCRRCWILASVWYKDKPVMAVQMA